MEKHKWYKIKGANFPEVKIMWIDKGWLVATVGIYDYGLTSIEDINHNIFKEEDLK